MGGGIKYIQNQGAHLLKFQKDNEWIKKLKNTIPLDYLNIKLNESSSPPPPNMKELFWVSKKSIQF